MKDTTKQVMILNNFASPYISEAIIILKEYRPELDTKVVREAERIVENYLNKKNGRRNDRPKRHIFNFIITPLLITGAFFLGYFISA